MRTAEEVRIAIIILNYKTPDLVLDCLKSLEHEIDANKDKIIVVDNHSQDNSVKKIKEGISKLSICNVIRVIESKTNGGFASGNNIGIKSIEAQAYLLLNSDTLVQAESINKLWNSLNSSESIGLISPALISLDKKPQVNSFRFHTPISELISSSGTGIIRYLFNHWDVPIANIKKIKKFDWTSFAAVMIKNKTISEVGYLDEKFFMYYEDVDYCRRVKKAGLKIILESGAEVIHLHGMTSNIKTMNANRIRLPKYYYNSRKKYYKKYLGNLGYLSANICWTLGACISLIRELSKNKKPHHANREWIDIWKS